MKKTAFFLLMLFTFYWAGVYHSLPLMVLCLAELLLFVVLLVLPRLLRSRLSIAFPKQNETARAGAETLCRVTVRNKGKLPVSRIRLRLRVWYAQDTKGVEKKLYGGAPCGEHVLEFSIFPAYCGLLQVRIDRLRAYDYLSLFSSAKRCKEEMLVAVFPDAPALRIRFSDFEGERDGTAVEQTVSHPGDSFNEIRQIREYRAGDPGRHIHRNLSARTDKLWIKEYEKDMNQQADVLLDLEGFSERTVPEKSAFYRLLSALVLGLLQETPAVRVHWGAPVGGNRRSASIVTEEQCRELLLALYQMDGAQQEEPAAVSEKAESLGRDAFRLSVDLSLFAGDTLLHRFSAETLEREMREKFFTV
ncbi:MAG: DUF58 domain-containing protein [Oscillospiraceae bacterium]|nr:DUF58 domain-containing protein [Oscillospiraceae bacterium]